MKGVDWVRGASVGLMFPVVLCTLLLCGKQQKSGQRILIDGDTLSLTELPCFTNDPAESDSLVTAARIRIVALGREHSPGPDTARQSRLAREFAERASLRLGVERPVHEWAVLLQAAQAIKTRIEEHGNSALTEYVDSVVQGRVSFPDGKPHLSCAAEETGDSSVSVHSGSMERMYGRLFKLPPSVAALLYEFVAQPDAGRGREDMASLVRGLLDDKAGSPRAGTVVAARQGPPPRRDNGARALQHRTEASIRDTILHHSMNIKALYHKFLRTRADLGGTVWIEFTVSPAGKVSQARLERGDLATGEFLDSFLAYAHTIRFSPIPEEVGDMRFVFPFAFSPE